MIVCDTVQLCSAGDAQSVRSRGRRSRLYPSETFALSRCFSFLLTGEISLYLLLFFFFTVHFMGEHLESVRTFFSLCLSNNIWHYYSHSMAGLTLTINSCLWQNLYFSMTQFNDQSSDWTTALLMHLMYHFPNLSYWKAKGDIGSLHGIYFFFLIN